MCLMSFVRNLRLCTFVILGSATIGFSTAAGQADKKPLLELMSPSSESFTTTKPVVHILGKTDKRNSVRVGGQQVPVYGTGLFVRDGIPLQLGKNVVDIE